MKNLNYIGKCLAQLAWKLIKFVVALAALIAIALLILWLWWFGLVLVWLHLPGWCLIAYNLTWLVVWLLLLLKA